MVERKEVSGKNEKNRMEPQNGGREVREKSGGRVRAHYSLWVPDEVMKRERALLMWLVGLESRQMINRFSHLMPNGEGREKE